MKIYHFVILLAGVAQMSNHLEFPWVEKYDPITGEDYYLNTETKERIYKTKPKLPSESEKKS